MIINSEFSKRSREVASRFLQTAVVIEDQPHFEDKVEALTAPGRTLRRSTSSSPKAGSGVDRSTHDLDAKQLIDAFAGLGVICAVLKPELVPAQGASEGLDTFRELGARTIKASKRSDIVILDWNIPPEASPGANAKKLIREIVKSDESRQGSRRNSNARRLRLFAVYTGESDLNKITSEVESLVKDLDLGNVERIKYRVRSGPVSIAVYGKKGPTIVTNDGQRRVREEELPECLLDDFTLMTEGLLSNIALEALSAIRTNTHRLLRRFHAGIDAPYVAHRAMTEPPEEAEEHAIPLIAAEIEGVLADDEEIKELLGIKAVEEWLNHILLSEEFIREQLGMSEGEFRTELMAMLKDGLVRVKPQPEQKEWADLMAKLRNYDRRATSTLTTVLTAHAGEISCPDMEFALLTSLRSQYDAPPPVLKLGTIVEEEQDKGKCYWICVQPVCDSVRIKGARDFPFLLLREKPNDSSDQFDFVVLDRGEYRRFKSSRRPFEMTLIEMQADKHSRTVKGKRKDKEWFFDQKSGATLRWIADLKTNHAHRLVDEFANGIKRVGLAESEWLRRMALGANAMEPHKD